MSLFPLPTAANLTAPSSFFLFSAALLMGRAFGATLHRLRLSPHPLEFLPDLFHVLGGMPLDGGLEPHLALEPLLHVPDLFAESFHPCLLGRLLCGPLLHRLLIRPHLRRELLESLLIPFCGPLDL